MPWALGNPHGGKKNWKRGAGQDWDGSEVYTMTCETADVKRPKEKQTVGLLPPPFPIKGLSAAPAD